MSRNCYPKNLPLLVRCKEGDHPLFNFSNLTYMHRHACLQLMLRMSTFILYWIRKLCQNTQSGMFKSKHEWYPYQKDLFTTFFITALSYFHGFRGVITHHSGLMLGRGSGNIVHLILYPEPPFPAFWRTRQIIRYRAKATLRRSQMKQYTVSNEGEGGYKTNGNSI